MQDCRKCLSLVITIVNIHPCTLLVKIFCINIMIVSNMLISTNRTTEWHNGSMTCCSDDTWWRFCRLLTLLTRMFFFGCWNWSRYLRLFCGLCRPNFLSLRNSNPCTKLWRSNIIVIISSSVRILRVLKNDTMKNHSCIQSFIHRIGEEINVFFPIKVLA